jgi:glycosyltransferase involved in cell wall biosynthesis
LPSSEQLRHSELKNEIAGGELLMELSFIIPALNEEHFIGSTIDAIHQFCAPSLTYEVIVSDHGSTDRTVAIAREKGAHVLQPDAKTIGALRNHGAQAAGGDILVFLDADVTITAEWCRHAPRVVHKVHVDQQLITGSACSSPAVDGTLLSRFWFEKIKEKKVVAYIQTGHMVIHRKLFERLSGFDETLVTGEDYDLCVRAAAMGARIKPFPELVVRHNRFPTTLLEFTRRERWHGAGDTKSLQSIRNSPVALASLVFLALHLFFLLAMYVAPSITIYIILGLLLFLLLSSLRRFGWQDLVTLLVSMFIFYFYYLGRCLSFLPARKTRWANR